MPCLLKEYRDNCEKLGEGISLAMGKLHQAAQLNHGIIETTIQDTKTCFRSLEPFECLPVLHRPELKCSSESSHFREC